MKYLLIAMLLTTGSNAFATDVARVQRGQYYCDEVGYDDVRQRPVNLRLLYRALENTLRTNCETSQPVSFNMVTMGGGEHFLYCCTRR